MDPSAVTQTPDPEARALAAKARWIALLLSPRAVLIAAYALHLGLLYYFTDRRVWQSAHTPVQNYDYALHVYQVDRAVEAFRQSGSLWSYDPFVLAGQPAGVVEDLTSKSVELFVIALDRLGVPLGAAFNLYILLIHLAMPAAGYAAARLFGLDRGVAALGALFWVPLWYFDSFLHWCWHVGMISWSAASYLSVLLIALAYRALTTHRAILYGALGSVAALLSLVHPFAVITVFPALTVLYARAARSISAREHALLWAGVVLAGSTALVWIFPLLKFRHLVGDTDIFLRPTLSYVLFDWLDLLKDVLETGQPVRTMLRFVCLGAAAVTLVRWHRAKDDRVLPLAVFIGGGVALAYLSGYAWVARQTQPYRHLAPATLAAALLAAPLATDLFRERRAWSRGARILLALAALLVLPRAVTTVLQYVPTLLPERAVLERARRESLGVPPPGEELPLVVMGHSGPEPAHEKIREYLESEHRGRGRIVSFDWVLGEYLAAFTNIPVLGGIPQRNIPHVAAHILRHDLSPKGPGDDPLRRYLELYAAGFVVTLGGFGPLDERRDLLEPATAFDFHRIYRVKPEPNYFAVGTGRVAEQALNRVRIEDAQGDDIVLRFHWLDTLRCRPGCTARRVPVPGDGAGFIGVAKPPASFEIVNVYE